jgi:hypothetical protein
MFVEAFANLHGICTAQGVQFTNQLAKSAKLLPVKRFNNSNI